MDEEGAPRTPAAALRHRFRDRMAVRVYRDYLRHRGPLLAAGLSQEAVFAVFAGMWLAFTSFELFAPAHSRLRDALLGLLDALVPGLIDTGTGGAIDPAALIGTTVLSWTGVVALVALVFTAVSWLSGARDAVLLIADLPSPRTHFVLLWLKDFALAIGFSLLLLASAAVAATAGAALDDALEALGIRDTVASEVGARALSLVLVLAIDTVLLAILYRVLAGARIPLRFLLPGAARGAVVLAALQVFGALVLGAIPANPLLAGFAVIITLLAWFTLASQVVLLSACWVFLSMRDAGVPLSEGAREPVARPQTAGDEVVGAG
ncbi:YihY/virulence factor BrkB family protein [Protaetiibacter intestinalis]|uniref:YihY/virulence factor BrkB family protein n=1 Tax=Protaetiibacter intestinalis TaxID=2419774 RepID=A0A387B7G9_9MICO|nr:YhjD/YihY/BrkB family envelope integrity protein [Protaetiibacter intestinalis]AYF98293.1 YihY/virulence factor BrkB family protein [Protaetiibacter intestinalis]